MSELCTHLDEVELHELPPSVDGCEEYLRDGGKWLHLRICLTCGHVGGCDDSPTATRHDAHPALALPELSPKTITPYGVQAAFAISVPACGTPCAGGTRLCSG